MSFFGSDGFPPEPTFFEGKVDSAWSPWAGFFSLATYKSQKIWQVSIFVTAHYGSNEKLYTNQVYEKMTFKL